MFPAGSSITHRIRIEYFFTEKVKIPISIHERTNKMFGESASKDGKLCFKHGGESLANNQRTSRSIEVTTQGMGNKMANMYVDYTRGDGSLAWYRAGY